MPGLFRNFERFRITHEDVRKRMKQLSEDYPRRTVYRRDNREIAYYAMNYAPILSIMEKMLGTFKGKKILEIGYAHPDILTELKKLGAEPAGLEISPAHDPIKGIHFETGSSEELEEKFKGKKFDVIFSRDVFEYGSSANDRNFTEAVNTARTDEQKEKILQNRLDPNNKISPKDNNIKTLKGKNRKLNRDGLVFIQTGVKHSFNAEDFTSSGFEILHENVDIGFIGHITILRKVKDV